MRNPFVLSKIALPLTLTASLLLVACGDDDGDNNDNTNDNQNNNQSTCPGFAEEVDTDVCRLQGTYTEDITLTADKSWLLSGGVFIGNDVDPTVLTVEPGTSVYGETAQISMLVITRGSQIVANGTAQAPIVFTSAKEVGQRSRGDWGGIILNGRATTNACFGQTDCEPEGEGGTGPYGGDDDADSCGTLRYARIEFAGRLLSEDNELNGLALQACGSGTTLEYLQIHMGKDDGIEFFGGTANFKYVLVTGSADDNLDWTDGWRGKGQFLVVQQYDDDGDQGIEADNNGDENAATPRSYPTLSNITLIGVPTSSDSDIGILLREGTAANIHNAVVMGFNDKCLDIDQAETFDNAYSGGSLTGELLIESSIFWCDENFKDDEDEDEDGTADDPWLVSEFALDWNTGNQVGDPNLVDPYNTDAPGFTPDASSLAGSGAVVPSDPFFDDVSFLGGVDPENDWTQGWTTTARD